MANAPLHRFINRMVSVLNRNLLLRVGLQCGALVAGLSLAWALGYRMSGHPAPIWGYVVIWLVGIGIVASEYVTKQATRKEAAQCADSAFGLKDALSSALHFEKDGREGEVYELQRQQASRMIDQLDPAALRTAIPRGMAAGSLLALAAAFVIGSLAPSEAVQKEMAEKQEMSDRTSQVKEQMEEFLDELLEELNEEELAAIDPNELKEWVRELKQTDDRKEALRQFAKMEQKIAGAMQSLEQRREEQLMKMAAFELEKSDKAEARQLGKELEKKNFKKAAEKLMEMKQAQLDAKKQGAKMTDRQKKLARLRAMSRRMAAAAGQPNMMAAGDGQGDPGQQMDMGQMMQELDENAELAEEQLERMLGRQGEGEDEFEKMLGEVDGDLDRLADRLKRMDARRKMKNRLKRLRRGLGQAQSFAMGRSQTLGLAGKGGREPGKGTDEGRREQRDEFADNGNTDRLKGQKGIGPSQTTVEDAPDGTGVSGRRGDAQVERSFQRQFESFVRRDDVSEEMKLGVREYFERIHETEVLPAADTSR